MEGKTHEQQSNNVAFRNNVGPVMVAPLFGAFLKISDGKTGATFKIAGYKIFRTLGVFEECIFVCPADMRNPLYLIYICKDD